MDNTVTEEMLAKFDPPECADPSATIRRLAALTPLEYDQQREDVAKELKVRVSTLDSEVAASRGSQETDDDAVVEELELWPEPVSGDVLNEIREDFGRHVFASVESLDAVSLWTLGSYCYDAFGIWSKLFFSSPERRCGKTVALEVLEANVSRALMASGISSSAIFRAVHAWKPCLIVDEADTFGKEDEELTGIINAGHRKRSAVVIRNVKVGDEHIPKKFSVWSPMAIAAIGRLRGTVMDRSIIVQMQRKAPGESTQRVPTDLFERNQQRRRRCLRWAEDNLSALRHCRVPVPNYGNDRAQDNWEPLFAIAQVIGGNWPQRAQAAYAKLAAEEEEEAVGPMLLSSIREVLEAKSTTKIFSQDLVDALVEMEDRPWCEWRRGKPMTQNSLAKLLHPYRIRTHQIRMDAVGRKGYTAQQFKDAFERYLTEPSCSYPPKQSETPKHPNNGAGSGEIQSETNSKNVSDAISRKPSNGAECFGVSVQKGGKDEETRAPYVETI